METLSQQASRTVQPDANQAQRSALGFELRNIFALKHGQPTTPFEDMLKRLDIDWSDAGSAPTS